MTREPPAPAPRSLSRTITRVEVDDIRFPTSQALDGSDAMNPDPDYSAAYVVLHTDAGDGIEGHGLTFTIGRGTELCVAAVQALLAQSRPDIDQRLAADPTPHVRRAMRDRR